MKLERITVTGADNATDVAHLVEIAQEFPLVEFGVLFSRRSQGLAPRWPSLRWVEALAHEADRHGIKLAAHLCGAYVRELVNERRPSWWVEIGSLSSVFHRVQINTHGVRHDLGAGEFLDAIPPCHQVILQHDGPNGPAVEALLSGRVVALFDLSHGAGRLPARWKAPVGEVCGYAGGLSASNVDANLNAIARTAGDATVWIDAETRLRTLDDAELDLQEVHEYVANASRWAKEHS